MTEPVRDSVIIGAAIDGLSAIAKIARLAAENRMNAAGSLAYALRIDARSRLSSHKQDSIAEL